MKKIILTSFLALFTLSSFAYTEVEVYENPPLPAYLAEKGELPPPPKLYFPSPEGIYVSGTIGAGQHKSIRFLNSVNQEFINLTDRKTITQGGVALGYLFKEAGWLNQADIQYISRNHIEYTGLNPHNSRILNTSIKSQTGMARIYSSLNIGPSIFPYIFAGVGIYHNKAPATITFPPFDPILPGQSIILSNQSVLDPNLFINPNFVVGDTFLDNQIIFFDESGQQVIINDFNNDLNNVNVFDNKRVKNSRHGTAGCGGLGVRFRFNRQISIDINYEYTYLGKLQDLNLYVPTGQPNSLFPVLTYRGDKMSAQAVNLTVIFQPWGYLTDPD